MKSILVIDDDPQMRAALQEAIPRMGYKALLTKNGLEALSKIDDTSISMIVTDMKMPKMDGLSFIKKMRERAINIPILVITGFATVENAVDAMKEGACDYLMKPFSLDALKKSIKSVMSKNAPRGSSSSSNSSSHNIITANKNMKKLIQLAGDIALSDITVLILGESGTGKELLAQYIHNSSARKGNPLVAVNCAAIPDNLLESELFGFEKGTFTGASESKTGKFELANGSTILLDEIGEMSPPLQSKLLRVLQEKEVDKIGSKRPLPIDVRVIATTNRDLRKEIEEGRFREDLYYRLNVLPLHVPPLRERPEDIPVLAEHFAKKFAAQLNKNIEGFKSDAIKFLSTKQWRGNIRELENTIHRAVLITKSGLIGVDDFMFDENLSRDLPPARNIKHMEMELILKTLEETKGNKAKTAKLLGVSVRTIRNKLNEYGKKFPAA
jgi:two-component system response regulator FlrC